MSSSSSTPMSSTISSPSPPRAPALPRRQIVSGTRGAQCTHMTMTRLYTTEFRCSFCLKPGSMGWIWRCTQDRELLIEDDIERENHDHLDIFSTDFPRSETPRKMSPEGRTSALSFFDEITADQFREYTTDQIMNILEDRSNALRMAEVSSNPSNYLRGVRLPKSVDEPNQSFSARFSAQTNSEKPWIPNVECQFKCCQRCRPGNRERSFISLNAVANGEYLPSAVSGFGFHLQGGRPVIPVETLRNIGLRPSPEPRAPTRSASKRQPPIRISSHGRSQGVPPSPVKPTPFNDVQGADTTFSQPPAANFYDSTAMTRSLNAETARSSYSGPTSAVMHTLKSMILGKHHSEDSKKYAKPSKRELPNLPADKQNTPLLRSSVIDTPLGKIESPRRRINRSQSGGIRSRSSEEDHSKINKLLTLDTHSEASDIDLQRTSSEPTTPTRNKQHNLRRRIRLSDHPSYRHRSSNSSAGEVGATTTTTVTLKRHNSSRSSTQQIETAQDEYVISAPKPLTAMEEKEKREGSFGNEPLVVKDGVAVTEEAVALHVPDVITQL